MSVVARLQQAIHRLLPAAVAAATVVTLGCGGDSPTGATPNPPGGSFAVEGVLAPGASVRLTGVSGAASVTIDGQGVATTADGARAVRLTVPVLAACEADGRLVTIAVTEGGATRTLWAPVSVPEGRTLDVGESRILSTEELACIQLPRGNARYALTMVDFRRDTTFRALARLAIHGDATAASSRRMAAHAVAAGGRASPSHASALHGTGAGEPLVVHAAANVESLQVAAANVEPLQVDPRLATADVGDRVALPVPMALTGNVSRNCLAEPGTIEMLTYEVVAATPGVVVIAPVDDPRLDQLRRGPRQASLVEAARLVDQYALGTLRRLMGTGVSWYPTANGRVVVALVGLSPGELGRTYGVDAGNRLRCPNSAELNGVLVNIQSVVASDDARWVATVTVHELAHIFDGGHGRGVPHPYPPHLAGWTEAIAENAVELFVRMVAGAADAAPRSTTGQQHGLTPPWGRSWAPPRTMEGRSPFWGPSRYFVGSQLLMAARELAGDAAVAPGDAPAPGSTFYERLVRRVGNLTIDEIWTSVDSVGVELGMSGNDFLDLATLAIATDDEVAAGAAGGLPQISSWDNGGFIDDAARMRPEILVLPGQGQVETISTSGGGHVARYLQTSATRGAAAVLEPTGTTPMRVRITRLR